MIHGSPGSHVYSVYAIAAAALAVALCGTLACNRQGDPPGEADQAAPPKPVVATTNRTTSASAALVDLTLGPVTTFAARCARCHGPEGAFYGDHYHQLSSAQLHEKIGQMMVGPGGLHPTTVEVDAMAAYHQALRGGAPFLCITNAASFAAGGAPLRGETAPDCEVVVATPATAAVRRHGPRFEVSGVAPGASVELMVRDGAATKRHVFTPNGPLWMDTP